MFELLAETINQFYPIENSIMREIQLEFHDYEFPARYKLVREGKIADTLYFINKGAARAYFDKINLESTTWFAFEQHFVTSLSSFVSQSPSFETIELIENSFLLGISYNSLQKLIFTHPSISHLYRKILESYFIEIESRIRDLQFTTAKEKYEYLKMNQPNIVERVNLGHIASFIGITKESLSRLRSHSK